MTDDKIKERLKRIEAALERIEERLDQLQVTAETILSRLEKTPVGSNAYVPPQWRKDALTRS